MCSDYPVPRLAAGSFADVIKMLYVKLCGKELEITAVYTMHQMACLAAFVVVLLLLRLPPDLSIHIFYLSCSLENLQKNHSTLLGSSWDGAIVAMHRIESIW